jgi:protein-S-isoprenylcysteine O-methyltransferase Ste14
MRATAIEFRLRMLIQVVIVVLGYWSPWIGALDLGRRFSTLAWLALQISRMGIASFSVATPIVIVLGSLIAALGAVLRIWGAAYLGYSTVHHGLMQSGSLMADGPYRYIRNPLYLGGWCMMIALSLTMPPSGALLTVALTGFFYLRLILGEEAFLTAQLGEPYQHYRRTVPRIIPRLRASLPSAGHKPHWLVALLTEIMPIGIFVTVACLSWMYDNELMLKAILISFGVSLVVRALQPVS